MPLGADGYFFTPLWTSFRTGSQELGILDWYTVSVGVTSLLALTYHGAMWVILKTEGAIRDRAKKAATVLWPLLVVFVVLVTIFTYRIQPQVPERMNGNPIAYILPLAALAGTPWSPSLADGLVVLEEVGEHFNLTRERIRQIEARAMSKLRHPSSDTGARDLLAV